MANGLSALVVRCAALSGQAVVLCRQRLYGPRVRLGRPDGITRLLLPQCRAAVLQLPSLRSYDRAVAGAGAGPGAACAVRAGAWQSDRALLHLHHPGLRAAHPLRTHTVGGDRPCDQLQSLSGRGAVSAAAQAPLALVRRRRNRHACRLSGQLGVDGGRERRSRYSRTSGISQGCTRHRRSSICGMQLPTYRSSRCSTGSIR